MQESQDELHWTPEVPRAMLTTTTPVGFEPTRGDPIGLAGRRLNHSAKVSLMLCFPNVTSSRQGRQRIQRSQVVGWGLLLDLG